MYLRRMDVEVLIARPSSSMVCTMQVYIPASVGCGLGSSRMLVRVRSAMRVFTWYASNGVSSGPAHVQVKVPSLTTVQFNLMDSMPGFSCTTSSPAKKVMYKGDSTLTVEERSTQDHRECFTGKAMITVSHSPTSLWITISLIKACLTSCIEKSNVIFKKSN